MTKSSKKIDYEITPLGMLNNAKIWHSLYRQNINLNTEHQVIAAYCLMVGFEMLLKSYLIFLNTKYCKHYELKQLNHDFNRIFKALSEEKDAEFLNEIKQTMVKYKLFETDMDNLRYPKKGDSFVLYVDYYKIPNEFDLLFDSINSAIQSTIMNEFYK